MRPLEVAPFRNDRDELCFALHDLTRVAPRPIALSLPGYFLLTQLDGEHTCRDLQAAFLKQFGQIITTEQIARIVTTLDQALMLDSPGFEQAYTRRRNEYLAAETRDNRHRSPAAAELRSQIEQMLKPGSPAPVTDLRGLIVPHLDYQRGGPCYADAYAMLAQAPPARRYVILGTNHFGRSSSVVVTTKDFVTPLGRVTTDREFVHQLEATLDRPLCAHQFDHHSEHSVELQLHVLQVCYAGQPFAIVPVLCPDPSGPTGTLPHDGRGPDLGDFADALATLLAKDQLRTVLIAGADLSHIGQRFGDEQPTTPARLEQVQRHDRQLLELLEQRREETFVETVRAAKNPTRICSAGCIYTLLRALPEQPCRVLRYHQAVDMAGETHVTCAAAVVGS
ncbi:MAG: AmmeMemoRadiSam system protein B [Phycisphaerae bacterium]